MDSPQKRNGKGKTPTERIENTTDPHMMLCKRRNGLLKKAYELSVLCDAEVGLVVFSPKGKLYEYSNSSMEETTERYTTSESKIQYYQQESKKLEAKIKNSLNEQEEMMGNCPITIKDLKEIEIKIEKAIGKIRAKKKDILESEEQLIQ